MVEITILCAAVASVVFGITLLIKSGPKKEEATTKAPEAKLPGVKPPIPQTVEVQAKKEEVVTKAPEAKSPSVKPPIPQTVEPQAKKEVKPQIASTSKNTAKPVTLAKMEAKSKQTKNKK